MPDESSFDRREYLGLHNSNIIIYQFSGGTNGIVSALEIKDSQSLHVQYPNSPTYSTTSTIHILKHSELNMEIRTQFYESGF